jgi:hypothetical protein
MTKIIVRSNQSSVNPTAGGQRVGVEYNDAGNRAAANMYGTIGKAFNAGLDVLNKEQEQNEALRVAKATNEFNLELGKLKVDYMQKRQGSNSVGVINDFLKDANVLSERIYAKSGIRYKLGEQAFKRITDNTLATDGVQLYKFQEQETQKYKQNVFDQSADNLINGVIDGESLLENYPIMEGLYRSMFPDLPKEQYKQVETEMANRYAAILVNDAVNQNNYTLAEDRLSYFRNKISPEVRTKLEAALYSEQEYVENSELSKQLVDIPPDEWDAYLENYAKGKGNITEGKYTFNPGVSFEGMQENAVQGIKGITGILNQYGIDDVYITSTKNDYSGHAPGSAHYEGVGVDVDSTKLGELDESSRNILADRMERAYPGLKVLNEYDDPSDYATAGHFHLDFTNYKGESRLGASGLSARRKDQIKAKASAILRDKDRALKEQRQKYKNDLALKINTAPTEAEAVDMINNSDLDSEEKIKLIAAQRRVRNPSNYMTTADAEMWKYVNSGNYNKDLTLMEEYNNRVMDSTDEITPAQQRMYNRAAVKLNDYYAWANHNYQTRDYKQDYSNSQEYEQMLSDIEYMAERGASKNEITEYVQDIAKENGFDEQYILDTIMWDKLGKIEGGVK